MGDATPPLPMQAAVALTGVTCLGRAGAFLSDVSLAAQEGEWLALFGPTACGKSALLRVMCGDIKPTSGSATIMGAPASEAQVRVCLVPDAPPPPGRASLRDALMARVRRHGAGSAPQLAARLAEAMDALGVDALRDEPERDLTSGQRTLAAIAAAVAADPAVLLLDNVTASLPDRVARRIFAYLDGRRAADGLTVVHATCSSAEAERADRVALLAHGHVLACEPPGELIRRLAADRMTVEADNPEEVQRTARGIFDVEVVEDPKGLRFSARDPIEMAAQILRHPVGGASVVHVRYGTLWDVHARLTAQTGS